MQHIFLVSDYPKNIVLKAKDRVSHISRSDAVKQTEPTKEMNTVIITLRYNSHNKVKDIVQLYRVLLHIELCSGLFDPRKITDFIM